MTVKVVDSERRTRNSDGMADDGRVVRAVESRGCIVTNPEDFGRKPPAGDGLTLARSITARLVSTYVGAEG